MITACSSWTDCSRNTVPGKKSFILQIFDRSFGHYHARRTRRIDIRQTSCIKIHRPDFHCRHPQCGDHFTGAHPVSFHFLISNRVKKHRFPWTASGLLKSIFSLSYFAAGSLIVTGCGLILVKWNPFKNEKAKTLYHRILAAYTWSVIYIMGNVKKKIMNPEQEQLLKPAVLIANHQSFLDILIMTMLYPKVILLTNEWVWNSPLFGKLVKLAGYYPVAKDIENGISELQEKVQAGYSIVVFPKEPARRTPISEDFTKGHFFSRKNYSLTCCR